MKNTIPALTVFAGLPGVGKTTLAKIHAKDTQAVYLRVDNIETPFLSLGNVEGQGYEATYNLARENLQLGNNVVVDLVNPLHTTRSMFVRLAKQTDVKLVQFECVLSDELEHKRRVENRDSNDRYNPSWEEVESRVYDAWDEDRDGARTVIDTQNIDDAINVIREKLIETTRGDE